MAPMALGVQTPQINGVQNFNASQANATAQAGEQQAQKRAAYQALAENALGLMGGRLDGEVNMEHFGQFKQMLADSGNPLGEKLTPELVPVIARGSLAVMQAGQDQQRLDLAEQQFQLELDKFNKPAIPDAPKVETRFNEETGRDEKVVWNSATQGWDKFGGIEAPGTNGITVNVGPNGVDYGDPGAGLVWQRDPEGKITLDERGAPVAIPFKGGKPYADAEAAARAATNKDERTDLKANVVIQDADRALELIKNSSLPTTGLVGDWLKEIGGTEAADVAELLNTVKANAGFAELQAMRESSPTGAALGNVTEKELAFLQATIGSLAQKQTKGQLEDNLKRVKNAYLDIIHGEGSGPPREKLSFDKPSDTPEREPGVPDDAEETKSFNGRTFYRVGGDWFEVDG